MTNIDRFAPLVAGVLIACTILVALIYAAQQFTAAIEGLAL